MDFVFEFRFGVDIKDYVEYFIDKVAYMRNNFIRDNYNDPEVIYMDWYTYKKLEIANRQGDYSEFSMLINDGYKNKKEYLFGMDIIVLPIQEELVEIVFLGYKTNDDNVGLGINQLRRKSGNESN